MKKETKGKIVKCILGVSALSLLACKLLNAKDSRDFEKAAYESRSNETAYERYIKRFLDVVLSLLGIIVLFPVLILVSITVFLEDPGKVVFTQKRVGQNKKYFYIHKLRSMRLDTPDIPTHLLINPDKYILKTGRLYRKLSVDELFQLFDILRGKMSIVGPRPALWNQDDLIAERDKYGANDVKPGLTGWAQINGRDELEISEKAKLDGEYCRKLKKNSLTGFLMDLKCVIGTVKSVLKSEGVVEGGTGQKNKNKADNQPEKKKHILVVCQYFYPETFRINDMCREWVKRGYKVSVVTGIPNYPMGKIFDGYGYTKRRRETWEGVDIYRIPLIPRGTGKIGMIANYLSFMISGIIAGKTMKIDADCVFSFQLSPMTMVLGSISFAKRLHVPHYMYVQDLWPDSVMTVTGITNPLIIRPLQRMVDYIYKNTDEIFATSPSFVDTICDRDKKVPREKVHFWPQYAEEFYQPVDRSTAKISTKDWNISSEESFLIAFTGNIGNAQGLDILPKTAMLLENKNVKFLIVGDGSYLEELEAEINQLGVSDKFIMIPRQKAEDIPMFLGMCDAAFISFSNDELWYKTIPAKLQTYMACGLPIVASVGGETERVICEAKCGYCSRVGDAQALADNIERLVIDDLENLSRNSKNYCENNFNKKHLMDVMDDYIQRG